MCRWLQLQLFIMERIRNCLMRRTEVEFVPEQWQQGIGELCTSCSHKLENEDCISLCRCYLFCHEQCFLREFSPHVFDNEDLICTRCQEKVGFEYHYTYRWECNKKPTYIIALVFAALVLLTLLILLALGKIKEALSDGAGYTIFVIGLLMLIGSTIYSMRRRYIDLDRLRVRNTNLLGSPETNAEIKHTDYENDLKKQTIDVSEKDLPYDIQ